MSFCENFGNEGSTVNPCAIPQENLVLCTEESARSEPNRATGDLPLTYSLMPETLGVGWTTRRPSPPLHAGDL